MAPEAKSGWSNPETQRKLLLSMLAIATEANTTFSADKIAKAMANMGESYTAKAITHQLPKVRADLTRIRAGEPVPDLSTPTSTSTKPVSTPRKRKVNAKDDNAISGGSGNDDGSAIKKIAKKGGKKTANGNANDANDATGGVGGKEKKGTPGKKGGKAKAEAKEESENVDEDENENGNDGEEGHEMVVKSEEDMDADEDGGDKDEV